MQNSMTDKAADLLQKALARASRQGASAGKIRFTQKQVSGCQFEAGRLKRVEDQQSAQITVELVADRRLGCTRLNDLADLDEMVDRAMDLAKAGSAVHFDGYPGPGPVASVRLHSERTAALTRQTMIDGCQQITGALKAYDPDLYVEASANRNESESVLVTSGGVCHRQSDTHWSLGAYVQRTEGTDMVFSDFGRGWNDLNEFYDPDFISGQILQDLRHAETIVPSMTGRTMVLLSPRMLQMFFWAVNMGINGRNVAKGESPLRDKLGAQVFDPCFTVVDDPHLDYCNGAAVISDDGIPTRRTTVFDHGVLKTFLYDLDSAGLAGAQATGHNRCQPYSLDLAPGHQPSGEMIASIQDGLYIKELMGFGQSNIINGDFSCNVALGFRIQGGRIVGRVKDTMIAGNIYELLKASVQLSSDRDPVLRMPYGLLQGAQVSAAKR